MLSQINECGQIRKPIKPKRQGSRSRIIVSVMKFSVDISASLIGQLSLNFIAVLHMFEHVLFYYQRQCVVTSLSCLCRGLKNMSWSQGYFDFSHDIARSEKRYVVVCVKTHDNTGNYISLKLFKNENGDPEFPFNQKLTLSMHGLEQVGENIDAIRRINFSKFANEQSSSGKRKFRPGSS